jgi:hypothetical protein
MLNKNLSSTLLMIRPKRFGFNPETFLTNSFQKIKENDDEKSIAKTAIEEFDTLKDEIDFAQIETVVFEDGDSESPDSIFPNNWFATLPGKIFLTFPMATDSRRKERREDIIDIFKNNGYKVIRDLEHFENEGRYLEGTGSLVLDHKSKVAYAAISPRTSIEVLNEFSKITGYRIIPFHSYGPTGELIYHTNVMMAIGSEIAILGIDTIKPDEQDLVKEELSKGHSIILITNEQLYNSFLGNCLFVMNKNGKECLLMSERAKSSLTIEQLRLIEQANVVIISSDISTIENTGGGSVRCMLAEIY